MSVSLWPTTALGHFHKNSLGRLEVSFLHQNKALNFCPKFVLNWFLKS